MTTTAIVMMVLFLVIVWGGLVTSVLYLRSHPTPYTDDEVDPVVSPVSDGAAPGGERAGGATA